MTWIILPAFSGVFLAPLSVLIWPNSPGVTLYVSWHGFQDPARSSDKPRKSIFNYMFGKTHKQFQLVCHWGKRSMWIFHWLNLLFGNFIHVDNAFGLLSLPSPLLPHFSLCYLLLTDIILPLAIRSSPCSCLRFVWWCKPRESVGQQIWNYSLDPGGHYWVHNWRQQQKTKSSHERWMCFKSTMWIYSLSVTCRNEGIFLVGWP